MESSVESYRHAARGFLWQNRFLGIGHFNKHFMHDIQKKGSTGKHFLAFSPRYS